MNLMQRLLASTALVLGACWATLSPAAAADYQLLNPPQATSSGGKIEVIEFFSYGCPHCNEFNPMVTKWAEKLPADVVFKRVPVSFGRAAWANVGKLYYALEESGELHRLDGAVFNAIHVQHVNLFDTRGVTEWANKQGADGKKLADLMGSFTTLSKMNRADQMSQAYQVDGVPMLAVDGRYLIKDKPFAELLSGADRAIEKARADKKRKK